MGQVTVSLNGRSYRLRCGDGEEGRLADLADYVGRRVDDLALEFGQYGDERLLLMVTLLLADEMLETKARLAELEAQAAAPSPIGPARAATETAAPLPAAPASSLGDAPQPSASAPASTAKPTPAAAAPDAGKSPKPAQRQPQARTSLEARLAEARNGRGVPPPPEPDAA